MMRNFTRQLLAASLLAACVMPVSAQVKSRTLVPPTTGTKTAVAPFASAQDMQKGSFRLLSVTPKAETTLPYSEYGTVVDIVTEDFSKMTTGSVASPDLDADISYDNPDNAWINMSSDYTQTEGWGSHGAYPAGGCLYIKEGQVNTPLLDVSKYDGLCILQFDVFTASSGNVAENVGVEAAETNHMGASWDVLGSMYLPEVTSEQKTYTVLFKGGGPTTLFNIYDFEDNVPIFVDNVRVYQIDQTVGTPSTSKHRYYHGEDFNLVWNKVKSAESYLIDLYTKDDAGFTDTYLLKDFDTQSSDTTYTVEGAESGTTYYYTLRGKNGQKESMTSKEFEIKEVAAPTLNDAVEVGDGNLTATWEAVPTAEVYNYMARYRHAAAQAGEMTVTSLVFPGMQYNEGILDDGVQAVASGTVKEPSNKDVDSSVLQDLSQAGWTAHNYSILTDALAIDGFQYYWNKSEICSLESPELDLSKDGGRLTVDTRLCAEPLDWPTETGGTTTVYARTMIALFNYDKETDDYVQTESWYVSDLTGDWKDYTHTFTMGSDRSVVSAFPVYAPGYVFFEHLKLTQNYQAGESFLDPFYFQQYVSGTSVDVPLWQHGEVDGCDIFHQAQAVRSESTGMGGMGMDNAKLYYSDWSTSKLAAGKVTGVQRVSLDSRSHGSVTVDGQNLIVNNPKGEAVSVYTLNGAQVFSNASGHATVSLPMPQHGAYIVKIGGQSIKLTL